MMPILQEKISTVHQPGLSVGNRSQSVLPKLLTARLQGDLTDSPIALIHSGLQDLRPLYAETAGNPQIGLWVIEPDRQRVREVLSGGDYREMILSPFVFWFLGERWREELAAWIRNQGCFQLPADAVYFLPDDPALNEKEREQLETVRETFIGEMRKSLAEWKPVCESFLARSKTHPKGDRPRIWAHLEDRAPVYRGITQSWLQAFAALGCEVFLSQFHREWRPGEKLTTELVRFAPDWLLFLNGPSPARFNYLGLNPTVAQRLPCRRITWYVDHPHFLSGSIDDLSGCKVDDIAVVDRTYIPLFQPHQPRSLFHLAPATLSDRRGKVREDWRFPLVYIGSVIDPLRYLEALSPEARGALRDWMEIQRQQPTLTWDSLKEIVCRTDAVQSELTACAQHFNRQRMNKHFGRESLDLEYFLYVIGTFHTRWETVRELLPYGLHIFGPDDWLALLEPHYRDRHHGIISWENLPDCYASADINLNFHSRQCPTSLNIRDFDVPRAGGFLLTDAVDDAAAGYLEEGKHFCMFGNKEELLEKVDYYLHRPDERRAIAELGCEHVKTHHTMRHRAEFLLRQLGFPAEENSATWMK